MIENTRIFIQVPMNLDLRGNTRNMLPMIVTIPVLYQLPHYKLDQN